ncbi:MAG: 50S ribosomal protein L9 [Alphaproteobacteria bacterium]
MEIILLERIENLGQMGDVVNVKPGFARNYLLPQKKALRATDSNRSLFETQRTQLEAVNLEQRSEATAVAGKLEGLTVVVVRQASDNDQLYGSVTVRDAAQAITDAGFTLNSKQVQMVRPIKKVGLHPVTAKLHPEVSVTVTVNVARSEEEALLQAQGKSVSAEADMAEAESDTEAFFDAGAEPNAESTEEPAEESAEESAEEPAEENGGDGVEADENGAEPNPA